MGKEEDIQVSLISRSAAGILQISCQLRQSASASDIPGSDSLYGVRGLISESDNRHSALSRSAFCRQLPLPLSASASVPENPASDSVYRVPGLFSDSQGMGTVATA